jgi:hypothetical protein
VCVRNPCGRRSVAGVVGLQLCLAGTAAASVTLNWSYNYSVDVPCTSGVTKDCVSGLEYGTTPEGRGYSFFHARIALRLGCLLRANGLARWEREHVLLECGARRDAQALKQTLATQNKVWSAADADGKDAGGRDSGLERFAAAAGADHISSGGRS